MADLAERAGLELPREAQSAREPGSGDLYEIMAARGALLRAESGGQCARRGPTCKRAASTPTPAPNSRLGYAPDSWNALLNRFGSQEDERRRLLQVGLIIERDTRGGSVQAGFYDRFRDRLMFPIRDSRGRVLAFGGRIIDQGEPKYLNSPETPLFHKGRELYGLYEARQARTDFKRLMIVEGYMDVVRLHQAGITYAVATLGTATTQEHLHKIFRITSELVFCFDGDRAGLQAAWRALENALPLARDGRELKFMFLPEGHDPDTLVAAEGADAFEGRLKSALPLSEYLVQQSGQPGGPHPSSTAAPSSRRWRRRLFARMPDGIYRELLADRLAAEIRMPAAKLKERLFAAAPGSAAGAGAPSARTAPPRPRNLRDLRRSRMSAGRGNLLNQAIALVLHHPAAARAVDRPEAAFQRAINRDVAVLQGAARTGDRRWPSRALRCCWNAGAIVPSTRA